MVKLIRDLKQVSVGTWVRVVLLAIGIVNYVLTAFGIQTITFSNEQVTEIVQAVYMAITAFYALWKNNNFTAEARKAQHYLNELKARRRNKNEY